MNTIALEKYRWVTTCPKKIITINESDSGYYSVDGKNIEKNSFPDTVLLPELNGLRSFNVLSDGWTLQSFRLFNPLIFSCAFGDDEIFESLALSFETLLTVGEYKGDLAVITDAENYGRVEQMLKQLPIVGEFKVLVVSDCTETIDYCLARFRFFDEPFFRDRQPVLYLDVDILCNAPIEPILADLAFSDRIHAAAEGVLNEGHPESSGHWYGWRMMAAAGMEFDPWQRGFSAGMIGYSHSAIAIEYAKIITNIAAEYRKHTGEHRPFIGYDQCLANYVFLKAQVLSFDLIGTAITLHRLHPDHLSAFPPVKLGLIHFLALPAKEKLEAMRFYKENIL